MPFPSNAVPITGPLGLGSSSEQHPTHIDTLGQGGFRVCATISERDLITSFRRSWGMLVYVREDSKYYKLCNTAEGGASETLTDNNNWVAIQNGLIVVCPAGLNWQGTFNGSTTYNTNDVVQYTDPNTNVTATYWAVATPSGNPTDINGDPNSAGNWQLFSAVGPQGQQGDQGNQGDPGNKWYTGITHPDSAGISGALNGDLYLHLPTDGNTNPANGDVYVYQNGDWVDNPVGNIQGPDGSDAGGVWPFPQSITTASIVGSGFASQNQDVAGLTAFQILQKLLFPYQQPTLTNFGMFTDSAGTTGQSTTVIIGTEIVGTRYFKVTHSNSSNLAPNTFGISQSLNGNTATNLYGPTSPVPSSGSVFQQSPNQIQLSSIAYNAGGSYATWRAFANNTQNPASLIQSNPFTITWRFPVYWGLSTSPDLSPAGVLGLSTTALKSSQSGSYTMTPSSTLSYVYFAYPVSGDQFGAFTNIYPLTSTGGVSSFVLSLADTNADPAQCTTCSSYNTPDGLGHSYKTVSLGIGPASFPVNYRVFRSTYSLTNFYGFNIS
jgi:hypothetical protein